MEESYIKVSLSKAVNPQTVPAKGPGPLAGIDTPSTASPLLPKSSDIPSPLHCNPMAAQVGFLFSPGTEQPVSSAQGCLGGFIKNKAPKQVLCQCGGHELVNSCPRRCSGSHWLLSDSPVCVSTVECRLSNLWSCSWPT